MGLSAALTIAAVTSLLFKNAIATYNYTYRQSLALARLRDASQGVGANKGLLEVARQATQVSALTGGQVIFVSTAGTNIQFSVTGTDLYRTEGGVASQLSQNVSSMSLTYYNMTSAGLIMQSTAANTASFVTAYFKVVGTNSSQRDYASFVGARLRNK